MSKAVPHNVGGLAFFYNMMCKPRGFSLAEHMRPVCWALMDERIRNLEIIMGPGAGKSMLLSIVYPAFEIGQDPTMTILGVSAGEALIQGFMKSVMECVEFSPEWAEMFPDVRPDKVAGWSTERGMYVTGRKPGDPDASYFAAGLTSSALTGKHARIVLGDDLHNKENAASAESCKVVKESYYKTILGRADPRGARFIMAGRRWSTEDLYGHLKSNGDYVVMELPAERTNTNELYWDVTIPDELTCCFNDGTMPGSLQIEDVR